MKIKSNEDLGRFLMKNAKAVVSMPAAGGMGQASNLEGLVKNLIAKPVRRREAVFYSVEYKNKENQNYGIEYKENNVIVKKIIPENGEIEDTNERLLGKIIAKYKIKEVIQ